MVRESEEERLYNEDCPKGTYIPTILEKVARIIAIGDIHGDYELAVRSFKLAGLIDKKHKWIANPKDTVVVQVGDQVDSCRPYTGHDCSNRKYAGDKAEDIKVIQFFMDMHERAKKYGGAVYSLFGNHEIMNADGIFSYTSYNNIHDFCKNDSDKYCHYDSNGKKITGETGKIISHAPGGLLAKEMACKWKSVIVIGNTMFAHAGVLPTLSTKLKDTGMDGQDMLRYLNAMVRKWLMGEMLTKKEKEILIDSESTSPFWNRVYGNIKSGEKIDQGNCDKYLKKALKVFAIGNIVVGNTPPVEDNGEGIEGTCYSVDSETHRLYKIDGGFSHAFSNLITPGRGIQVLEILNDEKFRIITENFKS